jgi:hypothetical protein
MPISDMQIEDTSAEPWSEETEEARHERLLDEARDIAADYWPEGTVRLLPGVDHVGAMVSEIAMLESEKQLLSVAVWNLRQTSKTLAVFRKLLNDAQDILDGAQPGDPPRPNWAMRALQELDRIQGGGE